MNDPYPGADEATIVDAAGAYLYLLRSVLDGWRYDIRRVGDTFHVSRSKIDANGLRQSSTVGINLARILADYAMTDRNG